MCVYMLVHEERVRIVHLCASACVQKTNYWIHCMCVRQTHAEKAEECLNNYVARRESWKENGEDYKKF